MSDSDYTAVTIVGRSRLFRDGLKSLLADSSFRIVEEAEEVSQIGRRDDRSNLQLVLLDAGVQHASLAEDVRSLTKMLPDVPVVVLSELMEHRILLDAMTAGASGYLLKDISKEALLSSFTLVMLGEKVFPTPMAALLVKGVLRAPQPLLSDSKLEELSVREAQILPYLVAGESNKMIARRLHVTEATVKVHLKSLMRKIGSSNRTQAAIWALNHGINGDLDFGADAVEASRELMVGGAHRRTG